MAITRTPIIDDDGTGTTGTVIDNAWKTELYDQIDAGPGSGLIPLGSGSGVDATPGIANLGFVAIPQMTLRDQVLVSGVGVNAGSAAITLQLSWYDPATAQVIPAIALTGPTAAGTLSPNNVLTWRVVFRPTPPGPANMQGLGTGVITTGTTQGLGVSFGLLSTANFATAGGYLYYQHTGVTGSPGLYWSWSVHVLKG